MKIHRATAGFLVPAVFSAECLAAVEPVKRHEWYLGPDQGHEHTHDETRGEHLLYVSAPSASGTNSTATMTSGQMWPSPDLMPREDSEPTVRVVIRVSGDWNAAKMRTNYSANGFPHSSTSHAQSNWHRGRTLADKHSHHLKRFVFRRP